MMLVRPIVFENLSSESEVPVLRNCFGFLTFAALLTPVTLAAQIPRSAVPANRAPDKHAMQILIPMFKSADKGPAPTLGARAAAEMRKQVSEAFPLKEVYVIPDQHFFYTGFEHGQFNTAEALGAHDTKALAGMTRADEYMMGSVERTSDDRFRIEAELALTRDFDARQPLGVAESKSISEATKVLVREMKAARKQSADDRKCTSAYNAGKFPEAIDFARAGIALYPKAIFARMCLLRAMDASKAPADSIAKVAREIVAIDPRNKVAIRYLPDVERRTYEPDSTGSSLSK